MTSETAIDLLMLSNEYGLERLKGIVENVIGFSLDYENVGCILDVAITYSAPVLQKACLFFSMREYTKVKNTDAWKEMSPVAQELVSETFKQWGIDNFT